ncbi:hypothetical protein HY78_01910 [Rhizorhabdus wittichii DC-6]|nr:hypothetical protein HY78_01910 [Rhizorhabdus wittichii DC-6]
MKQALFEVQGIANRNLERAARYPIARFAPVLMTTRVRSDATRTSMFFKKTIGNSKNLYPNAAFPKKARGMTSGTLSRQELQRIVADIIG